MADVSRVITLGDSGVGKTTLIHRMKTGLFLEEAIPTVAAGVATIEVRIQNTRYTLQIWDTAGQELYRSIIPIYFKGAVFAILCFSVVDDQSFAHLDGWLDELRQHTSPDIEVLLVGTKYDCTEKLVDEEEAREYAERTKLKLFWASALTGQNVPVILEHVALQCSEKMKVQTELVRHAKLNDEGCCCNRDFFFRRL
jgi:small GTP-binding protein